MSNKDFLALIEISHGENKVKYESKNGQLHVDRFLRGLAYPANYGSILNTMGGDGDPIDVFLITPSPLQPGCFINIRPIGGIVTQDNKCTDLKVIAFPPKHMTSAYNDIDCLESLRSLHWGRVFLEDLQYFLERYKDLQKPVREKVGPWYDKETILQMLMQSYEKTP